MLADARASLSAMQAQVTAALVHHGPAPADFDTGRLDIAATALAQKRLRAVARAWPELRDWLGEHFASTFAAYASTRSLPAEGGAIADGRAFVRWLSALERLPDPVRVHALAVDVSLVATRGGLRPRRWPCVKTARLRESGRLVVALRLPLVGELWLRFPLPG